MTLPLEKDFLTHIAYDCVVFGYSGKELKILIIRYHNTGLFALPGGFVRRNEDLEDAVKRGLTERTGLDNIYLEQFHSFGSLNRYDPGVMEMILRANGHEVDSSYWMLERFISIAHYALINYEEVCLKPDALSDSIEWYAIDQLPQLMLDHQVIVNKALQELRENIERKIVGMNLLPYKFTMKELQHVFEAILGEKLRRTSFQRRMLNIGSLKRHEKKFSGKAHRAPYLYSFISDP
jgi:ADP-ribose pyrophosphatase YjhB (NUDIX family)